MGFYYTPYWMAWLGMRDLVHGPRPEQNQPSQLSPGNAIDRTGWLLYDDSALALGSRSTGLGKMVQEPRARFHVANAGVFCHDDEAAKVALPVSGKFTMTKPFLGLCAVLRVSNPARTTDRIPE